MSGLSGLSGLALTGIVSLPSRFVVHVCHITPSQLSMELKRYLGQLALYVDLSAPSCMLVECSIYMDSPPIERLTVSSVRYYGERCTKDTAAPRSPLYGRRRMSPNT